MNREKAREFLEFILAHPDEDSPRLIFADWLEEEGDLDRAEFIRVQIERARLPEWDARQVPLRVREGALLWRHGDKWKRELPEVKGLTWEDFRRGFVGTAAFASFAWFRRSASACWAAAPVEAISIRWPRRDESVKKIPPVAGLRELSIHGTLVDQGDADRLANAPLLSTVRTITIHNSFLSTDGFRRVLASPHLGRLKALRVPKNNIGNGGIGALFDAASLASLEELDLGETGVYGRYGEDPIIEATGMQALAGWSGLARLRSLTLSGNDVGGVGLRALLRSPNVAALKELSLRTNGLEGQVMAEFGDARPELRLDALDLGENLLRDLGVAYLASAPCLRELKVLVLDRCEMGLSGARALAKAPFLSSLRWLNVNHNNFCSEGLRAILDESPQQLHTLHLRDNNLGADVSPLVDPPASETLQEIDLDMNDLGDEGAQALASPKRWPNLLILRLNDNGISRHGVAALGQSPLGKQLALLEILGGPVEDIPF